MNAILAAYPYPVRHIYSDSGGEFINGHFIQFCRDREIPFARSRPNHKNDNCYVEQRNYSVVRNLVGYGRYDSDAALAQLHKLYDLVNPFECFFQPSVRLKETIRNGSKRIKVFDLPQTPYQRFLAWGKMTPEWQVKLAEEFDKLSPVRLRDQMAVVQQKLLKLATRNRIEAQEELLAMRERRHPELPLQSSLAAMGSPPAAALDGFVSTQYTT